MARDVRTLARALTPIAVRDYALARGWTIDNRVKGQVWLLSHGAQPLRQLLVPKDVQDPAYETAMLDVAARLAEIECRTIDAVLADLGSADATPASDAPRRVYAVALMGHCSTTMGLLRDAVTEETVWQSDATHIDYEAIAFAMCDACARRQGWVLVPRPNDR